MSDVSQAMPLLMVLFLAVLAPIISDVGIRPRIPVVVLEILLGILVGPDVLALMDMTPMLEGLSRFGIAFLFFWVGYEINFQRLWGETLLRAFRGWLVSLAVGIGIGFLLFKLDIVASGFMIGLALTTSALGIVIPILKDAGDSDTPFGSNAIAMAAVGEVGPVVIVSILAMAQGKPNPIDIIFLVAVFLAVGVAAYLATRIRMPAVVLMLQQHLKTTSQLPIRLSILLLAVLFFLSARFGLDAILGALAAGIVVGCLTGNGTGEEVRQRLESVGFGLFIPIFFISTGLQFDLSGLLASGAALARLPLFLLLFLVVRGVPTLLYRDVLTRNERVQLAFSSATALPVLIALTEVATRAGIMRSETAAGLVGAGMLSVLVYPYLMLHIRGKRVTAESQA